jgi:ATP-dependent Clp protease ATP-binding subunit ClpC
MPSLAHNGRMFERFTDAARRVIVLAQEESRLLNHDYIGTEHLLLGLLREADGAAGQVLTSFAITVEWARAQVVEMTGSGDSTPAENVPFTPRAKKLLELSLREALRLGHGYIGTEHLLLGLIREGQGVANQVMARHGTAPDEARRRVMEIISTGEFVPPEPSRSDEPVLSPEALTEKVRGLERENQMMRQELERLREQVRQLGGEPDPPVA